MKAVTYPTIKEFLAPYYEDMDLTSVEYQIVNRVVRGLCSELKELIKDNKDAIQIFIKIQDLGCDLRDEMAKIYMCEGFKLGMRLASETFDTSALQELKQCLKFDI